MGPGKRCPILDNGYLTTPTPPLCPLSDWITIVLMTSANIRTVQAKNSDGPQQIILSRSTFPGTFNAHTAKLHGFLCPFGTGVVQHQQLQDFGCLEPRPKMWPMLACPPFRISFHDSQQCLVCGKTSIWGQALVAARHACFMQVQTCTRKPAKECEPGTTQTSNVTSRLGCFTPWREGMGSASVCFSCQYVMLQWLSGSCFK